MITATGLTKSYGSARVVDDVSFTCEPGTITGFLGPNGAGKSTTLRLLTGLSRPDAGSSTLAGRPYSELPNPPSTVGILLDPTAMHPGRSGWRTLALAARIVGAPMSRVDEVLRTVGLSDDAAGKRVGSYSLGMRQRLGIGLALLGDPEILLLDEPANGLDPEGIAWMRSLLHSFAERGGTVLLSSHLLAEVEATVDRLVVIGGGRIVARGSLEELLSRSGVVAGATDTAALQRALESNGLTTTSRADGSIGVEATAEQVAVLAREAGVLLVELRSNDRGGLEELFFSLTGDAPAQTLQEVA